MSWRTEELSAMHLNCYLTIQRGRGKRWHWQTRGDVNECGITRRFGIETTLSAAKVKAITAAEELTNDARTTP